MRFLMLGNLIRQCSRRRIDSAGLNDGPHLSLINHTQPLTGAIMPFWRSYVHLVWATKNRKPLSNLDLEDRLFAMMVSKAAEMDCYAYAVNGMPDHVHIVLAIPPKHSVAEVVKILKGSSAHFVNQILCPPEYHFQWQRGYGVLTLGESQLPRAVAYVQQQKEHHAQGTINRWLERHVEVDEGPSRAKAEERVSTILRDEFVGYDTLGEPPFAMTDLKPLME